MALITVELPGGAGTVVGEVEIRFLEESGRYRWFMKDHDGWADTHEEAQEAIVELIRRPYRGVRYVAPRGRFTLVKS